MYENVSSQVEGTLIWSTTSEQSSSAGYPTDRSKILNFGAGRGQY